MKHPDRVLLVLAALGAGSVAAAGAQTPDRINVSIGAGLMAIDHGPGGTGVSAYLRLGLSRFPLLLDASVLSAPAGVPDIVFCPGGCGPGGQPYTGPTTALSLAPAIQLIERGHKAAVLYRLGPSVSWLTDRAPGSASMVGGYRAGVSLRLGEGNSGFLISGDYFRLLRGSTTPRWFLPITIGWQF